MGWFSAPEYWLGRLALERGTAIIYLIAFVAAAQQFRPLIGEHGMLAAAAMGPLPSAAGLAHVVRRHLTGLRTTVDDAIPKPVAAQ